MKISSVLLVLIIFFFLFCACRKKDVSGGADGNANKPPVANAGTDIIIYYPLDTVQLDGSLSRDQDGHITNWKWKKINGPDTFLLVNDTISTTTVRSLVKGVYSFELKVTDNKGLSDLDTIHVSVVDTLNYHPPLSNAGSDTTIYLPATTAILDGSRSTDPDNNIVAYHWTKIFGPPSGVILNPDISATTASSLEMGVYNFELKVTDATGLFSKSSYLVRVSPPLPPSCDPGNRASITANLIPVTVIPNTLNPNDYHYESVSVGNKIIFRSNTFHLSKPGQLYDPLFIYDVSAGNWTTGHLSRPRVGYGMAVSGSKIYFGSGGWNDSSVDTFYNTIDMYDAVSNTCSSGSLSVADVSDNGIVSNNKVYFPTGNVVQIFDITSGLCTTAPLSEARMDISTVSVNNKIYFAGGYGQELFGGRAVSSRVDVYDEITNQWSYFSMQQPKASFAGITMAGKIYWAGGFHSYVGTGTSSQMVQVYNTQNQSSTTACLYNSRANIKSVIKNSKIIFFIDQWGGPQTNFDIYDTVTGLWSIVVLPCPVEFSTIVSHDNKLYVSGGRINGIWTQQVYRLEF
jgi:hypothetical protein